MANKNNSIITSVEVRLDIIKNGYTKSIDNILPYYSLEGIFNELGEPDYIFLGPPGNANLKNTYFIELYYLKERAFFFIGASTDVKNGNMYKICPDIGGNNYDSLQFFVYSSDEPLLEQLENSKNYKESGLLENITGISNKSFLKSIISQDNYCISYSAK
jgi:hypothetical protein